MELLATLDLTSTNAFFSTFFRLPDFYWRGFLSSSLSSSQLIIFALLTYVMAPLNIKWALMKHLVTSPAGSYLVRAYLGRVSCSSHWYFKLFLLKSSMHFWQGSLNQSYSSKIECAYAFYCSYLQSNQCGPSTGAALWYSQKVPVLKHWKVETEVYIPPNFNSLPSFWFKALTGQNIAQSGRGANQYYSRRSSKKDLFVFEFPALISCLAQFCRPGQDWSWSATAGGKDNCLAWGLHHSSSVTIAARSAV